MEKMNSKRDAIVDAIDILGKVKNKMSVVIQSAREQESVRREYFDGLHFLLIDLSREIAGVCDMLAQQEKTP